MFSVITKIYNKKAKGPTLMKLFTATGKLKKVFFLQLEMFHVCSTGDMAHIDTIFKLLPHTRQHVSLFRCLTFTSDVSNLPTVPVCCVLSVIYSPHTSPLAYHKL
jgi:hypothetical protein